MPRVLPPLAVEKAACTSRVSPGWSRLKVPLLLRVKVFVMMWRGAVMLSTVVAPFTLRSPATRTESASAWLA